MGSATRGVQQQLNFNFGPTKILATVYRG